MKKGLWSRRAGLLRGALVVSITAALMACGSGDKPNPNPNPNPNPDPTPQTFEPDKGLLHAPGKKGEVKTIQVNGKPLTYEVVDGLAIYQGDMVLGKASDVAAAALTGKNLSAQAVICDWDNITTGWGWFCGRWGGNTVPYSIQQDWATPEENAAMRSRIRSAIAHWETNTALRFQEVSGGVRLLFKNSSGCSSMVGRQENIFGEPQAVNLSIGCGFGAVVHEIGHAVGLYHEQSRADRNAFVQIHPENIEDGRANNFGQHTDDGNDVGPYNPSSIMHYGCGAFSRNGLNTITPTAPGITCADLGNRSGLTDGDILAAYHMYPATYSITAPAAGASIPRNQNFYPQFTAPDPIKPEFIKWYLDGGTAPVATGNTGSVSALRLSAGTHTVKAKMEISGVVLQEKTVTFTVTNVNPSVNISQPAANTQFCTNENVIFRALVGDVDGTVAENAVVWREGSTVLGTGSQAPIRFTTAGSHTLSVNATDNDGGVASASVTIRTAACTNTAPSVGITNPPDAPGSGPDLSVFPPTSDANGYYLDITLTGTASDAEDGAIPDAQMVWTTNRADLQPGGPSSGNQVLGTGRSLPVKLYSSCGYPLYGLHTITLTATDSAGNSRSMSRLIDVQTLC